MPPEVRRNWVKARLELGQTWRGKSYAFDQLAEMMVLHDVSACTRTKKSALG